MTLPHAVAHRCRYRRHTAVTGRTIHPDDGWLSLELVGMFGLVLVTLFAVLQGLAGGFALSEANTAARAAARAASMGRDPYSAAQQAVSPSLRPVQVDGGGETWTVSVPVPEVVGWMHLGSVTRSATIPNTQP